MRKFKYFGAYIIPLLGLFTFQSTGVLAYLGLFVLYFLIPVLEIVLPKDDYNFNQLEKEIAKEDFIYDLTLYLLVPLHLFVIYTFLQRVSDPNILIADLIACMLTMGTILGVNGINVGHELGHKTNHPFKMFLAQVFLTTAIQNHFITYHNAGHHKDIGTPKDLTSAKEGDNFYFFSLRSQIGGYFKTWRLEAKKLKVKNKSKLLNPMTIYTIIPLAVFFSIYYFYDFNTMLIYFVTSIYGISVLEAQNYFAHYGLRRKKLENGTYERVKPEHSWNSDHMIGRILLFELTRHSDHHHMGAKAYQILDSKQDSPMLPFGYPMMLMLSYFPFIFKPLMKKHLESYRQTS